MKTRAVIFCLAASMLFWACSKNTVSKIPHIALVTFFPQDSMIANIDTCYIIFSMVDGDGDIGYSNPVPGDTSQIYLKDSRYDSAGFVPVQFPPIDVSIEDPKKGIQGMDTLIPVPQPTPRTDSLHTATGDTLFYQFYITDRAGHHSDTITTHSFIVRP